LDTDFSPGTVYHDINTGMILVAELELLRYDLSLERSA